MLCTFTIEAGNLIVRSDDIRQIEDLEDGNVGTGSWALLRWVAGAELFKVAVKGTALENRDRIQQEELDLIARVEAHRYETQRRLSEGYPVPQVKRGKQ